jgi:hypothetical protein
MPRSATLSTPMGLLIGLSLALPAASARAQAPSLPSGDEPEPADRVQELEQRIDELGEKLRQKDEEHLRNVSRLSLHGYVDFGFFVPLGNDGSGLVRDVVEPRQFPEHAGFAWTFLGEILGTAVNTRGEAADLGPSPAIDRLDSIDSEGAPGFLVNELNVRLSYQVAERAVLNSSVNFVPRSGRRDFDLGDSVDLDIAELEYVLTDDGGTSLFVGKTLPVFGIEYPERKSDQRFGITPSLLHRYTSGPQLGLKVRSRLLADWVILAAAVSNNSSVTEQFHFSSEIDRNSGKTLSGRAALSLPIGGLFTGLAGDRLELGASGLWGPQDRARDNQGPIQFWGVDLQYLGTGYALKAQFMRGNAAGQPENGVWKLDLQNGAYAELNWQMFPWLGILGRASVRQAVVTLGMERIYVTDALQVTGGLRVVLNEHLVIKGEYLHNRELGRIAQIVNNDIVTSSLVLIY